MNAKLKTDALDLTSLLNGLVFFSPVSLLVRTLQESLSANSSFCKQLWLLWSSSQRFLSES
mgnify:FL=1